MSKKMSKKDFLSRIITLYGHFLDDEARKIWVMSCNDVLREDVNYDTLWLYFCTEYKTRTVNDIPSCQWLYQSSLNCLIKKEKPKEELPEGVPCPPEIKAKLKALFAKRSANF